MHRVFLLFLMLGMSQGVSASALPTLDSVLFPPDSRGTDGALVLRHGKVIYERYANGWTRDRRHIIWSCSKNFTGALVGIAIERGHLGLDDSVCKFFPKVKKDKCPITVRHLLYWSSGLDWNEGYSPLNTGASSVIQMLYGRGKDDMAAYALGHKIASPAGTQFRYSSGDTNILMAILKKTVPNFEDFPWDALFKPAGITSAVWERDGAGTFVGSSYLYLTPRDMARFGALYLNQGRSGTTQVVPKSWVDYSLKPAPLAAGSVGAQWWLNTPEKGKGRPYPNLPADAIMAHGHWGQYMAVVPGQNLIFIRFGDNRQGKLDLARANAALMTDIRRLP